MAPPPPVTPSPRRFLPGQRKGQAAPKDSRPASALRNQVSHLPDGEDNHVNSSQFAVTPRFSSARAKDPAHPTQPAPASTSNFVQALRTSARPVEDVEDAGAGENEDDEMLDNGEAEIRPTIEFEVDRDETNSLWTNDLALSPKRRRLDLDNALPSLGRMTAASESAEGIHPASNEVSRSTHSYAHSTPSSLVRDTLTTQRPAFVRAPPQRQEPSEPLPDAFSPHRRGQKFVPGGMAATVQQWVLETGQAAIQSRRGQDYLHGEDYVMRVKVEGAMDGSGPHVVAGKLPSGDDVAVLLAGGNSANISQSIMAHSNKLVGIRAPTWQLELDGRRWVVGVDWRLLS